MSRQLHASVALPTTKSRETNDMACVQKMKSVPLHVRAWKLNDGAQRLNIGARDGVVLSARVRLSTSHCLDVPIDFLQLLLLRHSAGRHIHPGLSPWQGYMLTLTDFTLLGHEWTSREKLITALGKCARKKRAVKLGEWKLSKRTPSENTRSCICNHYWDRAVPARISRVS
jgi:hypothetical protein